MRNIEDLETEIEELYMDEPFLTEIRCAKIYRK
jgi:hypothetical protein